MTGEDESVRTRPVLAIVLMVLAAGVNAGLLLNVAELQSAAMIVVHAHSPESDARPALDVGLIAIGVGALVPALLFSVSFARRWSLPDFLGWILVVVLAAVLLTAAAAFMTYRYWRDHQTVEAVVASPLSDPT